jgi:hypothetical protein
MTFESFSIAVFIISNPNTSAEQKSSAIHSENDILKKNPKINVRAPITNCNRKFFSNLEHCIIPWIAYLKEFNIRISKELATAVFT